MALSCAQHKAFIYDRGGERKLLELEPLTRVRWERLRDDISSATAYVAAASQECAEKLVLAEAGRVELVIFRDNERVWEGPVTHVAFQGDSVEITAKDLMYYAYRTIIRHEYDNRHPNTTKVLQRVDRVLTAEMARKEALVPKINFLENVSFIYASSEGVTDARTTSRILPYETTVFEHIDNFAARGGIDYTVVGRRVLFFDVHQKIGQTPMVTRDDFLADPIITQYGSELATQVAMTDGKGHFAVAGEVDPYYGEWEVLHQAYDEDAEATGEEPPSVEEMMSQAQRVYVQGHLPPLVVRVPENTGLNPNGVLDIADLVPGVWIPLSASLPGRTLTQMQKLDNMSVEETAESGEVITVTLSPAPDEKQIDEEEE